MSYSAKCQTVKGKFSVWLTDYFTGERVHFFPKCESHKELAQSFHISFTDKIKCIRDQFERVNDLHPPTRALSSSKFVCFHEVSTNEIQKILSNSPGTTCDLDPNLSALLKKCSDAVLQAMTKIINNWMNLGDIPSSLKAAQIRLMFSQ